MVPRLVKGGHGAPEAARSIASDLAKAGFRAELDERTDTPFGRRAVEAELKGVPFRIEVGPRDLAEDAVVLARRVPAQKTSLRIGGVVAEVAAALDVDQKALYEEALSFAAERTVDVSTVGEAEEAARTGWGRIRWADLGPKGEKQLAASGVTVRCLTMPDGSVPEDESDDGVLAVVGRAY